MYAVEGVQVDVPRCHNKVPDRPKVDSIYLSGDGEEPWHPTIADRNARDEGSTRQCSRFCARATETQA